MFLGLFLYFLFFSKKAADGNRTRQLISQKPNKYGISLVSWTILWTIFSENPLAYYIIEEMHFAI